jgi:hypothetical protein
MPAIEAQKGRDASRPRTTIEARTKGGEFLYHDGILWVVGPCRNLPAKGEVLQIEGDEEGQTGTLTVRSIGSTAQPYWAFRTLTVSPDVLLLLMPADQAPAFTRRLAQEYRKRFAKVAGRLPLGIANIFFPKHLPMFSVLDAGGRAIDNFRRLQEGPWTLGKHRREGGGPIRLGNGKPDPFHAHAICPAEPEVKSKFHTAAGWIAHREDLADGDPVLERMSVYDGILLGGSGSRLSLNLEQDFVRSEDPDNRPVEEAEELFGRTREQPVGLMKLEEFEACLEIWERLKQTSAGDRQMRNLWFTVESRREAWKKAGGGEALGRLGQAMGEHYLGNRWEEFRYSYELLLKTLQLHWFILKQRLDD